MAHLPAATKQAIIQAHAAGADTEQIAADLDIYPFQVRRLLDDPADRAREVRFCTCCGSAFAIHTDLAEARGAERAAAGWPPLPRRCCDCAAAELRLRGER